MSPVRILVFCAALFSGLTSAPAIRAQEGFGQDWKALSPEIRNQKGDQLFSDLPGLQQQKLRESQRKFHALSPDQKRSLCGRFLQQNGYAPPACQRIPEN